MKHFYTYGVLFFLPFTIYAYIKSNKAIRIKMILSGLGFGILSIIFDYIYTDYWIPNFLFPNFHFEDFLYGFLFAGILPSVHNIIFKNPMNGKLKFSIIIAITYILILLAAFYVTVYIMKLNNIYALIITPFIIGIISYIIVKGRIKDIFATVIAAVIMTLIVYNLILLINPSVIDQYYFLGNVSGIKLLRIPLEEWLFAVGLGVGCTYTYEALFNLK